MKGWFRVADAASYASVSPRTLRSWLDQGLRHSRVGGCLLIRRENLDNWLEAQAVDIDQINRLADEAISEMGL